MRSVAITQLEIRKNAMKTTLIDSAAYVAKTMFFFLFVGGLVGTTLTTPFVETLTHRPFSFPVSLLLMLLGYVVMGMPVAAFTGLFYGVVISVSRPDYLRRAFAAIGCGMLPPMMLVAVGYIWESRDIKGSVMVALSVMLFTGLSSLITAWLHWKAEMRFEFFQVNPKIQTLNG
jgi:hypothetical protein